MSKSKNDILMNSGFIRILHNSDHGKKIASVKIIDPETNSPFTYTDINKVLNARKESCAASLPKITKHQDMIQDKLKKCPLAEFTLSRTRKTKEEADKAVTREVLPIIDELTMILFQPYQVNQSMTGTIMLQDFYHFQQKTIFSAYPKSTQTECKCAMKQVVLPVLGTLTLKELETADWSQLKKKIERKLSSQKACESKCRYTRQALKKLYESVQQFNRKAAVNLSLMSDSVRISTKNTSIRQAFVPNHLDENQRQLFFQKVQHAENGDYLLFLVSCIYMGFSLPLLDCHIFGDIQRIRTASGDQIYSLPITRTPDKNGKTIDVTSENFPLKYFRVIVFSPWAADILVRRVEQLRQNGFPKVKDLPLSATCSCEPDIFEIEAILCKILGGIKGLPVQIPREDRVGGIRLETIQAALKLIYEDAHYVLTELCKANPIMQHASFGESRNTVDENHYLDTFSSNYTVHRYHIQSRFDPFKNTNSSIVVSQPATSVHCADKSKQTRIQVNPSTANQQLCINGKFAFCARWEERK